MSLRPLGGDRHLVTSGDRQQLAYGVSGGARIWIFFDGHVYTIEEASGAQRTRTGRHDDPGALMAPMPATVSSVNVSLGDRVSRGDLLMTLEAMKMEMPVRAPHDGTVTAISCRTGDIVQPGVPLVHVE